MLELALKALLIDQRSPKGQGIVMRRTRGLPLVRPRPSLWMVVEAATGEGGVAHSATDSGGDG